MANHRVDLTSGAIVDIAYGSRPETPRYTAAELNLSAPGSWSPGHALTMSVGHQNGTCFQGVEVHFIRRTT
jgi:hypothetical protein